MHSNQLVKDEIEQYEDMQKSHYCTKLRIKSKISVKKGKKAIENKTYTEEDGPFHLQTK